MSTWKPSTRSLGIFVAAACAFEVVALASKERLPTISQLLRYTAAGAGFVAGALWWHWLAPVPQ